MKRILTLVVEMDDDELIEKQVARARSGDGRLVYAYRGDAVADLRNVLANRGAGQGLDDALRLAAARWVW